MKFFFLKLKKNETPDHSDDDFLDFNFIAENVKVETTVSQIGGFTVKKAMKKMIKWLLNDGVITDTGIIDSSKLEIFYRKYHENVLDRTIR